MTHCPDPLFRFLELEANSNSNHLELYNESDTNMIEVEFKSIPASAQRVLIRGSTCIVDAVTKEFIDREISSVISDGERSSYHSISFGDREVANVGSRGPMQASDLLAVAEDEIGTISAVINICCPMVGRKRVSLLDYAEDLMTLSTATAERMSAAGVPGCIINHCMLPALYAGTELEDSMSILRGAITGVTRSVARRYGKQGIRCIGVQTGLIDIPDCNPWVSERLRQIEIPTKRWGTPTDVAKLIAFLVLDGSYITGQTIILDGGLTAGITGT